MYFEDLFGRGLRAKWGRDGAMFAPNELVYLLGFYVYVALVKIHQEMRA